MIYYRIAIQKKQSIEWEWTSTVLSSLEAVFQLRQRYSALADEQLRVFMASSVEYLDILLVRANLGLPSNSWTLDELQQEPVHGELYSVQHFEADLGWYDTAPEAPAASSEIAVAVSEPEAMNDSYDEPYVFALPAFMPHTEALLKLMIKVRSGELIP
jgi:hypothetical protein